MKPEHDALDDAAHGIQDSAANIIEVTPYELALAHVVTGGQISPKGIQAKVGCKKKMAGDLVLELQMNGIVSEPDDDGHRTLLAPLERRVITDQSTPRFITLGEYLEKTGKDPE